MMSGTYDILGWVMTALTMSNGGLHYNPEYGGEVYYDSPFMLGALTFCDDLIHKYKVHPDGVTQTPAMNSALFADQAAMIVSSTGSLSFIRQNMKLLYKVTFVPKNLRNVVAIGGASLVIPEGNSNEREQAAWRLIKWLTSPEIASQWSRFAGYFAANKATYELPEMKDFLAKYPDAKVALDQLVFKRPGLQQPTRSR